jgi:alanine racemase
MGADNSQWLDAPTSWLELSRANLLHNLAGVRALVGEARIMAVVKANGYGAGAVGLARELAAAGVDAFGVATVGEGIELRQSGVTGLILCLAYFTRADVDAILDYDLTPAVFNLDAARIVSDRRQARRLPGRAPVWVKVDTGLGRLGVPFAAAPSFIQKVRSLPGLTVGGLFSTLTENPERDPVQVQRLVEVRRSFLALAGAQTDVACRCCVRPSQGDLPLSLASSHGIVALPASYLDIVRPGILLHGLEPSERDRMDMRLVARADLRPIATWKARIADGRTVLPGEQIGYGWQPALAAPMRIATLAVGWADGYPPAMSAGGAALIGGRRCPVLAVSANSTIVAVADAINASVGAEVVLLGAQGLDVISADELARITQGSVYRLLAAIPRTVPRIWA